MPSAAAVDDATSTTPSERGPKTFLTNSLLTGSLIFGLFFGAGNLIFPVSLGHDAGAAMWVTLIGFLLTAVGLPVLGTIAAARIAPNDIVGLSGRVSRRFSLVFCSALFLTIGPFFAVPRTATVSYEMTVGALVPKDAAPYALAIFTVVFFALVALAAFRPGKIMDYVGKFLTPLFLVLLAAVLIAAVVVPMTTTLPEPTASASEHPFVTGIIGGYNTMDALGAMLFAIVIIDAVRRRGVTEQKKIAATVTGGGIVAAITMAILCLALGYMGATASALAAPGANGATILRLVSNHYYGAIGSALAGAIMLVACLKTSIGLITAGSETFTRMFPRALTQSQWVAVFLIVSVLVANVGLDVIIAASLPVLRFLYPLTIVFVVLALLGDKIASGAISYRVTIIVTVIASLLDLVQLLPSGPLVDAVTGVAKAIMPGYELGLGWILPSVLGMAIGTLVERLLARRNVTGATADEPQRP